MREIVDLMGEYRSRSGDDDEICITQSSSPFHVPPSDQV